MRMVLVTGVEVYREALVEALAATGRVEVTSSAASLHELDPEVAGILLVDVLRLEDLDELRDFSAADPERKIVALGVSDSEDAIVACAEAACSGLVAKESTIEQLVETLECVERGETVISSHIALVLLQRVAAIAEKRTPGRLALRLTARERQIVELIDDGLSNKQIAQRLCISVATAKNHVHNILEKLEVDRRAQAVARVNGR